MNLTFSSPAKTASEKLLGPISNRSYSDSQLFDWKPVHSATAAAIERLNPNNLKDSQRKPSDGRTMSVMTIFNAKRSRIFRFCLICAYVTTIWALKRLQKKALLEGNNQSFYHITFTILYCVVLYCIVLHLTITVLSSRLRCNRNHTSSLKL